jgi:hypothetical protein
MRLWEGRKVVNEDGPVISSSTGSAEVEEGTSGAPECTRRSALFWIETAAGGGTEEVDVEVSGIAGDLVRADELSCAAPEAADLMRWQNCGRFPSPSDGYGIRTQEPTIVEKWYIHGVFVNMNGCEYGRRWRIGRERRNKNIAII